MNEFEPSFFERLAEGFTEGGVWMYPISALGCLLPLLALAFVVLALVSKTNRALPLSIALLVLAIIPPSLGAMGARSARRSTEDALVNVNPADVATIRAGAESESLNLQTWGFGAALTPSVVGCLLLGLGLSRLPRFNA